MPRNHITSIKSERQLVVAVECVVGSCPFAYTTRSADLSMTARYLNLRLHYQQKHGLSKQAAIKLCEFDIKRSKLVNGGPVDAIQYEGLELKRVLNPM